jgi:hypothetical protein
MNEKNVKDERPRHFMKCRNPKCDSIEVFELKYAPGTRLYQCVKCKRSLPVAVGGKMDLRYL